MRAIVTKVEGFGVCISRQVKISTQAHEASPLAQPMIPDTHNHTQIETHTHTQKKSKKQI